ncbi:hypothetical protein RDWZM_003302 [Blomia tropicalis]|uniref:Uncharacterized protein n=1 Tax=Blomia tropicalis TaxID=40697 RepID=A0A9Q0MHX0_BLOTA|nr:hypothetical protein RDWZM_003302 [Blomia tropicalis]
MTDDQSQSSVIERPNDVDSSASIEPIDVNHFHSVEANCMPNTSNDGEPNHIPNISESDESTDSTDESTSIHKRIKLNDDNQLIKESTSTLYSANMECDMVTKPNSIIMPDCANVPSTSKWTNSGSSSQQKAMDYSKSGPMRTNNMINSAIKVPSILGSSSFIIIIIFIVVFVQCGFKLIITRCVHVDIWKIVEEESTSDDSP